MNKNEDLIKLVTKYSSSEDRNNLHRKGEELYNKFIKKKQDSIFEAVAISAGLTVEVIKDTNDPQIIEAFQKAYPNLDIDSLSNYSSEQLEPIINTVKGKYFEILLVEKINAGEAIGGYAIPEGYIARLAGKANQPVWDLEIVDGSGNVADQLQVKAHNTFSQIKSIIEENPDIKVIVPSELAERYGGLYPKNLIDGEEFQSELTAAATENIQDLSQNFAEDFLDYFNPLIPLGLIAFREGGSVLTGKYSLSQALQNAKKGSIKSLASLGVGASLAALDFGVVSIPATFFTRISIDRFESYSILSGFIIKHKRTLDVNLQPYF